MEGNEYSPFWTMSMSAKNSDVLEIFVYDQITSEVPWWMSADETDGSVLSTFVAELQSHKDVKHIDVFINSPGGSVFAALAMVQNLKRHQATISTFVDGLAASAATLLMQAADEGRRFVAPGSMVMIHNPAVSASGDIATMEQATEILQKCKASMMSIYETRSELDLDEISTLMDAETWMTAEESCSKGFSDELIKDASPVVASLQGNSLNMANKQFDVGNIINSAELLNKLKPMKSQEPPETINPGGINMNADEILARLSDDEREAVIAHFEAEEETEEVDEEIQNIATTLQVDVSMLEGENNAIVEAFKAQQAQITELENKNIISEFKEELKAFSNLPLQDEHVTDLQSMKLENPDSFENLKPILAVANEAIGAQMKATGTDHARDVGANAFDQIQELIAEHREGNEENISYEDAMAYVTKNNPELWAQHNNEVLG